MRSCSSPRNKCAGSRGHFQVCLGPPCQLLGDWSDWSLWTACSVTCGLGKGSRSRSCSPGALCDGKSKEERYCQEWPCPQPGMWSSWSEWSACSLTCGVGTKSRRRSCGSDASCDGDEQQGRHCQKSLCPPAGQWLLWAPWSACSVTCGRAVRSRMRSCSSPRNKCAGSRGQFQVCLGPPCQLLGNWLEWSQWGACSVTCDRGRESRSRSCVPAGAECKGEHVEERTCQEAVCTGKWMPWSPWGACSVTCGLGERSRSRSCSPSDAECVGNSTLHQDCQEQPCQPQGNWLEWSQWSACSVTCDQGKKPRSRSCVPAGAECKGEHVEERTCQEAVCTGMWMPWSPWRACSVTCGMGDRSRSRSCSPPEAECVGNRTLHQDCQEPPCQLQGNWLEWSQWSACSVTCDRGRESRSRSCVPAGAECKGEHIEERTCQEAVCTEWQEWQGCSVTCGTGIQRRSRSCPDTECVDEIKECVRLPSCREAGDSWDSWSPWSLCSVSCDLGIRDRSRLCNGTDCHGIRIKTEHCLEPSCQGVWAGWSDWSDCTLTCDAGTQRRSRRCTSRNCLGKKREIRTCDLDPCIGQWSPWNNWTGCSSTCGPGLRVRYRDCPETNCPANDSSMERERCQTRECPVGTRDIFP